jgi:hypothetical protein
MIDPLLNEHLEPVARRYRRLQLWRGLAICWALAGLLAIALGAFGVEYRVCVPLVGVVAFAAALWMGFATLSAKADPHWLARQIEQQHPELKTALLAALEQKPDATGNFSFLQQRVIAEAVVHGRNLGWTDAFPARKLALAHVAHVGAFAFFVAALMGLRTNSIAVVQQAAAAKAVLDSVAVTPGDTQVERGNSLVVLAKFEGKLPPGATLVLGAGTNVTRSIALTKSLDDPVFGGSVPEVNEDFSYRVEFAGQRTRDFAVKVFEHPKLERADAKLTFPAYTQLPEKTIEDTRRISAVEGSALSYTLQLNKPVKSARLLPKKDGEVVTLATDATKPFATLAGFALTNSQTYQIELVDADGRTNKVSAQFVFDALRNRAPELKLASPRGDQRVSALEEIQFAGEAWDDFGLRAYGIAYSLGGAEPTLLQLGEGGAAKDKRAFSHVLRLEELGAAPDQLVAWFAWADDVGPDGEVRRTATDMYFAEVRPFEEIFRQGQGGAGEGEEEEKDGKKGSPQEKMGKLAELQKQIINATWKLRRQQGTALTVANGGVNPVRQAVLPPRVPSTGSSVGVGKAPTSVSLLPGVVPPGTAPPGMAPPHPPGTITNRPEARPSNGTVIVPPKP